MLSYLRNFKNNISAVAAIEFAILLPLLLLLFFGSFEVARFIIASRKADNIANDIGYLLSREGDINDGFDGTNSEGTGQDADRIRNIVQSVVPMMIYPFKNEDYELEVRFVGIPSNLPRNEDGEVESDDAGLRIMWAHCEKRLDAPNNRFEIDCDNATGAKVSNQSRASIENRASETIGDTSYSTSTYFDITDRQRAKASLAGQSFILVNFAYSYDQILNNFSDNILLNFDGRSLEKLSSYAVRSRWIDNVPEGAEEGDGKIQPSEFRNSMHICVDCNIWRSNDLTGGTGREPCRAGSDDPSSGCNF